MHRSTASRLAAAVALVAVVALAGCTSKKDDETAKATTTTTEVPAECEEFARDAMRPPGDESTEPSTEPGGDPADDERPTQTTLPPRCAEALFAEAVEQSGSDAVKDLDAERRLGFAHGACAYATALTIEGTEPPTYKEFVATTSSSWDVSAEVVEEIVKLAATLCPGQLAPLTDLESGASQVPLRLQVTGTGTAQVSYQGPDGTTVHDEVTVPWDHEVTLGAPTEFTLSARIPDGEATCSVTVGDDVVVENTSTPGENIVCTATAAELREAAR